MSARSSTPLAVAILGLLLAIVSYGIKDPKIATLVYGSGLISAGFALLHWFMIPQGRKVPPSL
ncbi:hypothetical protein [Methylocystis sp. JR02]|uniref:hypothetical protein n=1 Tax=Methylocystis sp. JR02 TaxID=3046284 RepID=UPI0024B9F066|nr:hypothetical protein [Methylocystis sp. JR02]MDJ0450571.1 hypothetical protein [Methylocystis sp. JR02]